MDQAEIAAYNAGYHRGLNTEFSEMSPLELFKNWIAGDVWSEEPAPFGAEDCYQSFEDGYIDGILELEDMMEKLNEK
jgi:hypothetical protein